MSADYPRSVRFNQHVSNSDSIQGIQIDLIDRVYMSYRDVMDISSIYSSMIYLVIIQVSIVSTLIPYLVMSYNY